MARDAHCSGKDHPMHFVTYGDDAFAAAKVRIAAEATATGRFRTVSVLSPENVSADVRESPLFSARRGGGYWIWKPDVILSKLLSLPENEILFYFDAGCRLFPSREWNDWANALAESDVLAFRMWHRTYRWTKRECLDFFAASCPPGWERGFQYFATFAAFRKTEFSVRFVREWRDATVFHPELVSDVDAKNRSAQQKGFLEHRHDQSIFSALVEKHRASGRICTRWEHSDTLDCFSKQAVWNARQRTDVSTKPPFSKRLLLSVAKRAAYGWFDLFG